MGGINQETKDNFSKAKAPCSLTDETGLLFSVRTVART
jgi:hypothetical protein